MRALALFVAAAGVLVGSVAHAAPIHCTFNVNLYNQSLQLDSQLSMNLTLVRDDSASTQFDTYYVVTKGNGTYTVGADQGKLKVEGGRYSTAISDLNRYLDVRLTTGPRKDVIYRIEIPGIRHGVQMNELSGSWTIPATGATGTLDGLTDCGI